MIHLKKKRRNGIQVYLVKGISFMILKVSHNLTELLTNVRIASCLFILIFKTCTKYKPAKYYEFNM